jgi:type IV pilus assembly protein PilM
MKIPFERYFVSQRTKPIVGVDIGSSSIKIAEVDIGSATPKVLNIGVTRTPDGAFSGSSIVKPELLSEVILKLFESTQIETRRVAFALPASSVFTKRISMSKASASNLASNIEFEASNYIPHRIDAVNLDFQVIDENNSNTEVLLVAVKQDFLAPYLKIFNGIDLEPVIADVESFAICNIFEKLVSKDILKKPTAIVDIGYRHTTVSILNKGIFVLSGEINVGTKNYLSALIENLKVTSDQANLLLSGVKIPEVEDVLVNETIDRVTDYVGAELNRQVGFFWNGAGQSIPLEQIFLSGGGGKISGLVADLRSRSALKCDVLRSEENLDISPDIDRKYLEEVSLPLNVALGLAIRRSADKELS